MEAIRFVLGLLVVAVFVLYLTWMVWAANHESDGRGPRTYEQWQRERRARPGWHDPSTRRSA